MRSKQHSVGSNLLAPSAPVSPAVMEWRRRLKEHEVRSMASEYLRGNFDPACKDAYDEYLSRGYDRNESLPPSARRKTNKRRKGRQA